MQAACRERRRVSGATAARAARAALAPAALPERTVKETVTAAEELVERRRRCAASARATMTTAPGCRPSVTVMAEMKAV